MNNFNELNKLQKNLINVQKDISNVIEEIIEDISNEFLETVKQKTPNSDNNKLKNNWKKKITKVGNDYNIEIYNDLEYASSVEYGHIINDGKGYKKGHYMLKITQQEIENRLDKIVQPKINNLLKGVFK